MPRTAKDNELIRAARRAEIFLAAGRVFAKKGFAATKIADIAAEAKLSHGLLYHYFRSKEEVYGALFEEILRRKPELDAELARIPRAVDRVEHRVATWLTKSAERPELTIMVTQALVAAILPGETHARFLRYSRDTYLGLVSDIAQAQLDGDVIEDASPLELATAVTSLVRGLATMHFVNGAAFEGEARPAIGVVTPSTVMRLLHRAAPSASTKLRRGAPAKKRGVPRSPESPRSGAAAKKRTKKEKSRAA